MSSSLALPDSDVFYPSSDGEPLGETAIHVNAIMDWCLTLQLFLGKPRAMVLSNVFLYYEKGNPRARRAPDVMVIKGVPSDEPDNYKTWVYGKAPDSIFEFSSRGTCDEDLYDRKELYERIRVKEYFLFDPKREYLDEPFIGFRLQGDKYVNIPREPDGSLISQELGLRIYVEGTRLRGVVLETGERLLNWEEQALARQEARAEAELERQRTEEAKRSAAEVHAKAMQATQAAHAEKARAEHAEAEIARLTALLAEREGQTSK